MFDRFKKPQEFQKPPQVQKTSSGCKIKVRRDNQGRVTSIETNGLCSRGELDIFRENMNKEEIQEE